MAKQNLGAAASRPKDYTTRDDTLAILRAGALALSVLNVITANQTLDASNNGLYNRLVGSPTVTLPVANTATSTKPLILHFSKIDGNGVAKLQCQGSDTFENGLSVVNVYQESFTAICYGSTWLFLDRPKGWISAVTGVAYTTAAASIALGSIGFNDPEIDEVAVKIDRCLLNASGQLGMRVTKNGAVVGNTYTTSSVYSSSASAVASVGVANGTSFVINTPATAIAINAEIFIRMPALASGLGLVKWSSFQGAATGNVEGKGVQGTSGQITALSLIPITATAMTIENVSMRVFRD